MAKAKRKSITSFLEDLFRSNPSLSIDELTSYVQTYVERPDVNKLIRQHYRNITNRVIRTIHNKNGKRRVYADKKLDVYVDVEHENDIDRLKRIRKTLRYQSNGNESAYKLVTKRLAELSGQTVLDFEKNNPCEKDVVG
ncbi:hypothetical protein Ga0466249_003832 [Sporomusaceae bacterium BoRhaA]|uniref:hypothetical protein n=1 Tax=Pelorhabdus rhamnosifermentans TaxID=2772457 RepID=UPI001C05F86A|nr:hypothetical protein [Pelorhabdus rhamnosifermentans]MBU2702697.1 hypothetical protein [Pelorhabdus rhamnosifermentans]